MLFRSVAFDDNVAEFACKAVMAVNNLTVDDDARSDAGPESDHDEVFHAAGCAIGHFSESGGVGVVGDCDGNTEFGAYQLCQRQVRPWKIDCIVDVAGVIVGIGSADADTLNFVYGIVGFNQTRCLGIEFFEVIVEFSVFFCLY